MGLGFVPVAMKWTSLLATSLLSLLLTPSALVADSSPPPVPIVPSRDAQPISSRREPAPSVATASPPSPTSFLQNALSSWASWPQMPAFGQPWPNTLLGFPSIFPAAVSAESPPSPPPSPVQREPPLEGQSESSGAGNGNSSAVDSQQQQQFVGIRARFNPPTFEEVARLFFSVFSHEAQHINIRPQKQCFPEGCFRLHTFRITGFQRPRAITLKPLAPNLLLLNILSFDVDIESLLNGNVQLLLTTVPVTGNFLANTRQLSITALFDLQKDQNRVPYLRMASCELRSGSVSTKLSNLGLITDSINIKYKTEMLEKARELITSTICETISDTIKEQVNQVLRRLPRALSVASILQALSPEPGVECPATAFRAEINSSPGPPLALQLDSPQRFYSSHQQLSYSREEQQQLARGSAVPGWGGRFWRRRQRRGLERLAKEDAGDEEARGRASIVEITGETNRIVEKLEKKAEIVVGDQQLQQPTGGGQGQQQQEKRLRESANKKRANCTANGQAALLQFLDMNSLAKVFIDMDFMDSSSGPEFFAVGLSGDVFLRVPHQVSYVGGGVREVLAAASGELHSNGTARGGTTGSGEDEEEGEEEDKSLLRELELGQRSAEQRKAAAAPFPPVLRFPSPGGPIFVRKSLELLFSDLTTNLMLLQAHRAKLLKVRIGTQSTLFGPMLKTSCGPDEVCLGDSVPEAAEKYPDQQLEIEVEPVQPPRIKFTKDLASLSMIGAATFFLARNGQPIARIPFTAIVELAIRTILPPARSAGNNSSSSSKEAGNDAKMAEHWGEQPGRLEVSLAIPKLEILEDVDFFELPAATLEGFRDAARGAILSSAAKALAPGISLDSLEKKLCPWGISQPGIQLLRDGLVLLSAELDAYTLLFEDASAAAKVDLGQSRAKCTGNGIPN